MGVVAAAVAVVAAEAEDEEKEELEAVAVVTEQRLEWEGTGDRASSIRRKRRCRMRASRRSFREKERGEKKQK